jgi:hypothetical protein
MLTSPHFDKITDRTDLGRERFPRFTPMSYRQLSAGKEGDNNTETVNARNAKLHRSTALKDERQFVVGEVVSLRGTESMVQNFTEVSE